MNPTGLLYTSKYPISVSPCEPELYSHFRPHTHHNPICFTNFTFNNPNSPCSVMDCINGFQNFLTIQFQDLEPIKRPFKASNHTKHYKTLKQSVKPSRINPLPHGVCRNSSKPESTRRLLRVDQLSFLPQRISTVGLPRNLERMKTLSLKVWNRLLYLPLHVLFFPLFKWRRQLFRFVFSPFKNLNNDHYVPKLGFSTFCTISIVHFYHFSTHATCLT